MGRFLLCMKEQCKGNICNFSNQKIPTDMSISNSINESVHVILIRAAQNLLYWYKDKTVCLVLAGTYSRCLKECVNFLLLLYAVGPIIRPRPIISTKTNQSQQISCFYWNSCTEVSNHILNAILKWCFFGPWNPYTYCKRI